MNFFGDGGEAVDVRNFARSQLSGYGVLRARYTRRCPIGEPTPQSSWGWHGRSRRFGFMRHLWFHLFRLFVSVGFVLMRSGRSSWVGSDWVGSWWLQPAGIASDRGWWGGFNLHAMKILGSGPNGSGGSSWTRLGRAGTAQIGMLCMGRNRTGSAWVQSHQVQSELIGGKL